MMTWPILLLVSSSRRPLERRHHEILWLSLWLNVWSLALKTCWGFRNPQEGVGICLNLFSFKWCVEIGCGKGSNDNDVPCPLGLCYDHSSQWCCITSKSGAWQCKDWYAQREGEEASFSKVPGLNLETENPTSPVHLISQLWRAPCWWFLMFFFETVCEGVEEILDLALS